MTKSIGMLVAGEVGPAETRLALCGLDMGRPVVVVEDTATNADFAGLGSMVQRFLAKHRPPQIRAAAFVVAGPVHQGVGDAANLSWPVEAGGLGAELGIERVSVLNAVEAIAHSVQALRPEDLFVLSNGDASEPGHQAVVAAGANPGMSGLYWNGTEHRSFVSHGGHADFAPSDEDQLQLASSLSKRVARVTVELLLSDAGLGLIHRYLAGKSGSSEASVVAEAMQPEEAAAVIVRHAAEGSDPVCRRALDMLLSIYGSAAANLVLTLGATGGLYLAGSIVPCLRSVEATRVFLSAFHHKPPMQEMLGKIPVHAILDERAALLGAAATVVHELRTRRSAGWAS
jgi:glucokinase